MNKQAIARLHYLHGINLAYNQDRKNEYHRLTRQYLAYIAKLLGLLKGSFEIRSNMGGIAVCGEITLHADDVYVQFGHEAMGLILARTCNGRRDFTGGRNQWISPGCIDDPFRFAEEVAKVMAGAE